MNRRTTFILLLIVLLASACDFPYGPSYTIERQRIQVTYTAESPARIHVAATYRMKITGDRELSSIRAVVPLGAQNFRAAAKGASLTPGAAEKQDVSAIVPLVFAVPLTPKSKIELTVEFDVETRGGNLYFAEPEWFVDLRPPEAFLAGGGPRAKNVDLAVRVPENYRVLSGGVARGARHRGSAREFRFRFRDDDFNLFLLAGPYLEQEIHAAGTNVFLWTLKPLAPAEAQRAADRLTQTTRFYEDAFGPRIRAHDPIWIVDFATSWRDTQPGIELRFMSSFPRGALINLEQVGLERFRTASGAVGLNVSASLDLALAELWFTHVATPDPDIGVLNLALSMYAQRLAGDAQGISPATRASPADELSRFDRLLGAAHDTPILLLEPPVSGAQLRPARQKAILFLLALEEEVGRQNLLAAVKRMIQSLRGSTYGWNELRAAVEAESGQDLAEFFRLWLDQPGIPAEFRARYAKP